METSRNQYVKRTQKDYSYSFKLQVVSEIERGELSKKEARLKYGIQGNATVTIWLEKYGNLDLDYQTKRSKMKSQSQKILELEQQIKLLEKKNKTLAQELDQTNKKAIFFDMMIDIAEEELDISIRKKSLSNQSKSSQNRKK